MMPFIFSAFVAISLTVVTIPAAFGQPLDATVVRSIDSLFARYDNDASPGCAVGIYRDGKILFEKGYGVADLEHKIKITPQTVFDIGSTSKQFTAASILILVQQKKLSLDDDIRTYLPEIRDYGHTITVRNLLNHTSGIRDYVQLLCASGINIDDVTTPKDALAAIARQTSLNFEPGTEMLYSNSGYFLLAQIVERVSGTPLRVFENEHIFKPLGMTHTQIVDDHTTIVPNRAIGYDFGEDDAFHRDVSYWEQTGDGAIFTTIEDFIKWDNNFDRPQISGTNNSSDAQELVRLLQTPGKLNDGTVLDYCFGLEVQTWHTLHVVEHDGSWGGYRTEFMRIPSEHLTVVILSNHGSIRQAGTKIAALVLGSRLPADPKSSKHAPMTEVKFDTSAFAPFEGNFALDDDPAFVLSISRKGTGYWSQATNQMAIPIYPSSDSTFFLKIVEASLTFHRDANGTVNTLTLHQHGDNLAHRVSAPPVLTAKQLEAYTGEFYSPELQSGYRLFVNNGALHASHPRFDTGTFTPASIDKFSSDMPFLRDITFERSQNGEVDAMLVSMGRVRNIRFTKKR